jgi:glycosyltransferase involved in cell wall biosynthesis
MKIGFDAQRLFRSKKHGMEVVSLELLRSLQQKPGENHYEVFVKKDTDSNCLQSSDHLTLHNTPSYPYPVWEQIYLPLQIKKEHLQLLHCSSNTAPVFCSIPLVVTIHDLIYLDKIDFKGSSYQNFGNLYRRWVVPIIAKKAAAIITVSAFAKTEIARRLNIPTSKIFVVHNGVNEKFKKINNQQLVVDFRIKYQLPSQFFLHFANDSPRKNTLGTLKAYAQYCKQTASPIKLVLTNITNEKTLQLLNSIDAKEAMQLIVCLSYVSSEELPLLYNAATVFVYPSFSEGFGLPVIEAMACGTSVITANNTSLPEVAGDAAILIDATNTEELSNAMLLLSTNEEKRRELMQKGLLQAAKFRWDNAAIKIKEVYSSVLKDFEI